ncbi:MAG: PilC/PilY family type IV pilus protein, partial [Proteobacteria bacterium]|nr:PilC/PilY family type IV pilus protein [Pseudomonadota bacterium]
MLRYLRRNTRRAVASALAILLAGWPLAGLSDEGDDLFLLRTSISPNVVLVMDNSASMDQMEWHWASGCSDFDNDTWYEADDDLSDEETHCGRTRTICWADSQGNAKCPNNPTYWDGRYLNWYFSAAADPYINEIDTAIASTQPCQQSGGTGQFAEKYRRTRFQAAKHVLLDLICVAEPKNVRFAIAEFREADDVDDVDPNGGFVTEDLGRANPNHAGELESAIKNSQIASATPLAETLFQIYTFWMSRTLADIPLGQDGVTQFPRYQYDKTGAYRTVSNSWLEDAIEFECEKAFVILVTDGDSSRDDFDSDPNDTSKGFDDFDDLIGDYNSDGEVELTGSEEGSRYLDDIALYMQTNDYRPDLAGDQLIDTYTVGFATDPAADTLLAKTADVGNGLFLHARDGDELFLALLTALNDIVEKAQSFTAAAVPSARTLDGGDFYQTYFFPTNKSAAWEGHIRAWHIAPNGDILDANRNCALDDPDPGECNSGTFLPSAVYFWDAHEEMPAPGARTLVASKLVAGTPSLVDFDDNLSAADLSIEPFTAPPDPAPNSAVYPLRGSTALNEEGLADEVVAFARGCAFGTGVGSADVAVPAACATRPAVLGDVFHSNPTVVRHPKAGHTNASYAAFKTAYETRSRVLYAGSNGGFLHGFHAGDWGLWNGVANPPLYNEGSGQELFGFMPWEPRQRIKNQPVDDPTARTYFVDGSPQVADMWLYSNPTTSAKLAYGSEWRTVLVGGLRQGGHHYYAVDITNPNGVLGPAGNLPYPGYLWEFPRADAPDVFAVAVSVVPYIGLTWGEHILPMVMVKVGADYNGG